MNLLNKLYGDIICISKAKYLGEDEMWLFFSFPQKEKYNKIYLPPRMKIAIVFAGLQTKKAVIYNLKLKTENFK